MDLPDKSALLVKVRPYRDKWDPHFRPPGVEAAGPGQESVWDYPRPPIIVPAPAEMRVEHAGQLIARSSAALEVKETAGAPVPYFPPDHVQIDRLVANGRVSVCEWKGAARSFDYVSPDGTRIEDAAWSYPDPFDDLPEGYAAIAGWFAFYPAKLDCFVDAEKARSQPGGLYGGWITDRVRGPVKGALGTSHW